MKRVWIFIAIGTFAAACVPWLVSDFLVSVALTCLMYVALATSWSLFCGATRYLSLATSAFFGVGAYTSAVLHLRGTYFAVLTFGMTELIRHAITYFEKQISGTVGRVLMEVPSNQVVYLTVLAIAALSVIVAVWVRSSRFGLALSGIGSDEQRTQTLGVHTRRVKIAGFAITAAFAGAVGAAMAVRWTYIDPHAVFSPFIGFQTVLIALIGGAASLAGPLVAAIVFSVLAETLRLQLPYAYMIILGVLLILSVLFLPNGLAALWQRKVKGAANG